MPIVERSSLVPYTCAEMFSLVNDFESYPEFLPWCSSGRLHQADDKQLVASLGIKKGMISDSFKTSNMNDFPHTIQMHHLEGPFKHLHGQWSFDALGNKPMGEESGCKISLYMDFSFKNGLMNLLTRTLEHDISMMIDAFVKRAESVYGQRDID